MAVVTGTIAILMVTTMVTGIVTIVIIAIQGVALAIGDEAEEQWGKIWVEGSLLKLKFSL